MTFAKEACAPASRPSGEKTKGILLVESDPGVRWSLERGLSYSGYQVKVAATPEQAVSLAQHNGIAAVLMEIMPEAGFTVEVLSRMIASGNSPVVLCSAINSSPRLVTDCVQRGASGFLLRPFGLGEVRAELLRALRTRCETTAASWDPEGGADQEFSLIVGVSEPIQELRAIIRQVAQTNLNCLIRGESGVGKDVVAREIHHLSSRRSKPFVKVNCTALPEMLLESELFGYEKGAFTGAIAPKPGRFTLADKGIIFLDEICDVPMSLQAKLLQVIEHKEFTTLGGQTSLKVDVQIIAATNAPIEQRIQGHGFRQDLFFRLNEICIRVPTLAERKEDIPLLVRHFVQKHSCVCKRRPPELSVADLAALQAWNWPGNVRELESTVKRWLTLGQLLIGPDSYREHSIGEANRENGRDQETPKEPDEPSPERIRQVLEECQWNRRKACEVLDMSYQALRRRILKHNLTAQG